jgi:glutaredoxin
MGAACGNPTREQTQPPSAAPAPSLDQVVGSAKSVRPPFALGGEAEGLLLVWYDADGTAHTAASRTEIPEDRRAHVRVDSLEVPPDARLDPSLVYVADLRKAGEDGTYTTRTVAREAFEAALTKPAPAEPPLAAATDDGVIIYGASWCGACRQAASYLRQKNVPFVEKDIEKEPGARSEMAAKAKAQGLQTSGIPVIDVYGKLMGGFSPGQLDALLSRKGS